jgi:hypothetical protein
MPTHKDLPSDKDGFDSVSTNAPGPVAHASQAVPLVPTWMKAVAVLAAGAAIAWGSNTLAERSQQPRLVSHPTIDSGPPPAHCPAIDQIQVTPGAWICDFRPYDDFGQQPKCVAIGRVRDRIEDKESPKRRELEFKFHNTNTMRCPGKLVSEWPEGG